MQNLNITPLTADEAHVLLSLLKQVQRIHVEAHPDVFHGDASDEELVKFLEAWLRNEKVTALVAHTEEGSLVGYLVFEIIDKPASPLKKAQKTAFIHHVAVDEIHRSQGVGTRLIEAFREQIKPLGTEMIGSEHFAFNQASARLMKSAGLKPQTITVAGKI